MAGVGTGLVQRFGHWAKSEARRVGRPLDHFCCQISKRHACRARETSIKKTTLKSSVLGTSTHNLVSMASYLHETVLQENINKNDESSLKKWNSSSNSIDESNNVPSDNFDCNIYLDTVQDPVVTLCGHLYCWPCIYKWIDLSHKVNPLCPIPRRPSMPSCGVHVMPCQQHIFHGFQQEVPDVTLPTSPISGMFGEMVYEGIFGNSRDLLFGYEESYGLAWLSTQRARRQTVRDERSSSDGEKEIQTGTAPRSIDGPVVQLLCSSVSEEGCEGRGLGVSKGSESGGWHRVVMAKDNDDSNGVVASVGDGGAVMAAGCSAASSLFC
ncbi:unnamed protein product [Lactuca virosa]|uniref:E3 ubiquitin-protein ligase RMA n=1 Tax=Lactuca virosa TaxID=75947 RepID=A0AAU9MNU1_9ASTR|nr:unnamed protein product [Lactuca virosa]